MKTCSYCGECIYFRAGAGCIRHGLSRVIFETIMVDCVDFVDIDEVTT